MCNLTQLILENEFNCYMKSGKIIEVVSAVFPAIMKESSLK
jgi:hypothetical protein